jgi:hypothetical protein
MLTPYHTNKDPKQVHPVGYAWYDDVIVPTQPIAMINGATPPTTPTIDSTPPSLTNISVSSITATGATITWTTNEPADSQVEYGVSTSYGNQIAVDTPRGTSHSQTISGLSDRNCLQLPRQISCRGAGTSSRFQRQRWVNDMPAFVFSGRISFVI